MDNLKKHQELKRLCVKMNSDAVEAEKLYNLAGRQAAKPEFKEYAKVHRDFYATLSKLIKTIKKLNRLINGDTVYNDRVYMGLINLIISHTNNLRKLLICAGQPAIRGPGPFGQHFSKPVPPAIVQSQKFVVGIEYDAYAMKKLF